MQLTHTQAVVLMVANAAMWSMAGLVTRQLESARSFEVTFWRSLFTVVALLVILPLLQGRGVFQKMRSAGPILWISGLCWATMFTAFMVALTLTTVANVLVTMSLGPLLTALFARVFLHQRIPVRTWAAIVVASVGIAWMFGQQAGPGGSLAGVLVALGVPLAAATNWCLLQKVGQQGAGTDMLPAVLIGACLSALVALPVAWPLPQ